MFDTLSTSLTGMSSLFKGNAKTLDETSVQDACQVLRNALLEADVSFRVARQFVKRVREKALSAKQLDGWDAEEQFMGLMHQELRDLLGDAQSPLKAVSEEKRDHFTPENPAILLMCGLQGAGKTTTSAKLALWLKSQEIDLPSPLGRGQGEGNTSLPLEKPSIVPFLIAADTVRPAAMEQLAILGDSLGIGVYKDESATSMLDVVVTGLQKAKEAGATHVLIDTAGRLQADTDTMADLLILKHRYKPTDILLVVDAMIGQESVNVVEAFHMQIGLSGCVLSKMDGDTKGGAMLSIREATGIPIQFLGTGETPEDLEPFHPDRMAQRLMGMGDLATLFEKAMASQQEASMASVMERVMKGELSFRDYLNLQESIQKMGGMGTILAMLPMMQMNAKDRNSLGADHKQKLRQWKALLASMKAKEVQNPSLVLDSASRQDRLFKGAGLSSEAGKALLDEFSQLFQMAQGLKAFSGFFGSSSNDDAKTIDMTASSPEEAVVDPDDPMGWGDFFGSFGGGDASSLFAPVPKSSKKSAKKKSNSPFPWG
ncbi:MAG: signal recognition particle protein [Vampirovibrionales bacterium]